MNEKLHFSVSLFILSECSVVVTSAVWPALVMYHSLPGPQWSPWWWSGQATVMMEQTTDAGTVSQTVSVHIYKCCENLFCSYMKQKIWSGHNFAHATADQLPWHVQNWPDRIPRSKIQAKQMFTMFTKCSQCLHWELINHLWNVALISSSQQNRSRTHGLIELMLFGCVISYWN